MDRLPALEGGVHWPSLQPAVRDPAFRMLRDRVVQDSGAHGLSGPPAASRGASGLGDLEVAYIADRPAATMTVTGAGFPQDCLTSVTRGGLWFQGAPRTRRPVAVGQEAGLVHRGAPGMTRAAAERHKRLAVRIPTASLHRPLSALLDEAAGQDLAFEPAFAWEAAPAQGLRRPPRLLVEELGTPAPFGGSELARRAFVDLFLYRMLHAVPDDHTARLARAGGAPVPAKLRRAEASIRAQLEEPIAMHELAEAAGCSVRGLQLAFRRFRDTTPLAAVRRTRLEAVRDVLPRRRPRQHGHGTRPALRLRPAGALRPAREGRLRPVPAGSLRDGARHVRGGA